MNSFLLKCIVSAAHQSDSCVLRAHTACYAQTPLHARLGSVPRQVVTDCRAACFCLASCTRTFRNAGRVPEGDVWSSLFRSSLWPEGAIAALLELLPGRMLPSRMPVWRRCGPLPPTHAAPCARRAPVQEPPRREAPPQAPQPGRGSRSVRTDDALLLAQGLGERSRRGGLGCVLCVEARERRHRRAAGALTPPPAPELVGLRLGGQPLPLTPAAPRQADRLRPP